jgi:hypothetical protein
MELLKTVDGVFMQRFCCYPHEEWTYQKYDLFLLKLIYELISDEFLDGQLTKFGRSLSSRFSDLKKARKYFKEFAGRNRIEDLGKQPLFVKQARWLRFLLPLYREYTRNSDTMRKAFLHGTLCQTRCAGKPPPLDKLQAKIKFLKTVTTPDQIENSQLSLVNVAMGEILQNLPDHIFTGLSTKAGISVTSSACYEYTRQDEGTLHAIQDIVMGRETGVRALNIDLNTGKVEGKLDVSISPGTYIFFRCLEEVLRMPPSERSKASLVVVDEPGKNRAITKARACLKIVLDVVNKICAIPLERGFNSSKSGMGKSNHTWNTFKEFEILPLKGVVFNIDNVEDQHLNSCILRKTEFKNVLAVSTDYENATDYLSHKIAKVIGYQWMLKCGIPRVLRNLVCEVAFKTRTVYFTGNLGIGTEVHGEENLYSVNTQRGVLMGDPLTKVILHFTNVVARHLSVRMFEPTFIQKILKSPWEQGKIEELLSTLKGRQ